MITSDKSNLEPRELSAADDFNGGWWIDLDCGYSRHFHHHDDAEAFLTLIYTGFTTLQAESLILEDT